MSTKKIIVSVFPDGSSITEAQGFKGKSCNTATKEIELALAGNDTGNISDKKSPDFFATTGNTSTQNN